MMMGTRTAIMSTARGTFAIVPAKGGYLTMSANIFGCHTGVGGCCWHLEGRGHEDAMHK